MMMAADAKTTLRGTSSALALDVQVSDRRQMELYLLDLLEKSELDSSMILSQNDNCILNENETQRSDVTRLPLLSQSQPPIPHLNQQSYPPAPPTNDLLKIS